MKTRLLYTFFVLSYTLSISLAIAEEKSNSTVEVAAPVTTQIVKKQVSDDFETTKENLEMAITGQGLRVSGTLHVSEMLNRTGKDLGFDKQIFAKAESLEFCSALISHKMAVADSANISVCPFTIAVYSYTKKPETVYVSYRLPTLLGDAAEVTQDIKTLLDDIVAEATE
jgi:uncharacterized protein (DUF302 family)